MNLLQELGLKYNTDKSRISYKGKTYLDVYDRYFSPSRLNVKTFVEIGILNGSSLKMWSEYFPNATIYGIDIDPQCKKYETDRIKIFIGSQSDVNFLNDIKQKIGEIDILVDDGSHITHHQIITFDQLFDSIKSGGYFAIEDLLNSYEERWKFWNINNDVLRNIWPGMRYNDKNDKLQNIRKDFDDFILDKIKSMDYLTDSKDVISIHFHAMQVLIEKN